MPNIFDYIAWRGDLSFKSSAFNNVDNLILSRLAFLPLEGIVGEEFNQRIPLSEIREALLSGGSKPHQFNLKDDIKLIRAAAESPRFRNLRLSGYINLVDSRAEKQFAAICLEVGDGTLYVAYRGTDKSLIGWKEDFNMSFLTEIPAQRQAVLYLEQAAEYFAGKIRLGGHSKGGNLAAYAGAFCNPAIQARLIRIYNNDGPGFHAEVLERPGFRSVQSRIVTFVPQTSIVGMLLEHEEKYTIVKSNESGLFQHDLYSWQVNGKELVYLDTVSNSSKFIDRTLKDWIAGMDQERRGQFVDGLFEVLCSTRAETFDEIVENWYKNAWRMGRSLYRMDPKMRRLIRKTLLGILRSGRKNISVLKLFPPKKHTA